MDDLINDFLNETRDSLADLDVAIVQLEQTPNDLSLISKIFRVLHTIKGTCGFLGLHRLEVVAHRGEDLLGLFRDKKAQVSSAHITAILSALDVIKAIVAGIEKTGKEPSGNDNAILLELERLYLAHDGSGSAVPQVHAAEIQNTETVTETHPETAPEVSAEPGGVQSLRVNVDVLENLMTMVSELVLTRNQLLQVARNSKEGQYTASLQRLNHVVSDLQEGVMKTRMQPIGNAWQKLPRIVRDVCNELGKKIELEMQGQDTELDRQILDMIKDPLTHMVRNSADHGIESPAERVMEGKHPVGRIRLNAYHQGGHIIIEISDDGRGLPTEKIRKKIVQNNLATEEQAAEMSLQQIQQYIFHPGLSTADKVTAVSGRGVGMDVIKDAKVLRLRGKLLPLVSLSELLQFQPGSGSAANYVVVTKCGNNMFGIIVDQVFDLEEIVIKPLSRNIKTINIFSGNTILGDGCVIMILDPAGVLKRAGMLETIEGGEQQSVAAAATQEDENLLLLFKAGDGAIKAAPVEMVSRLEEIEVGSIEIASGQPVVQYLGSLMPVLNIDLGVNHSSRRPLIVLQHDKRTVGLLADQILDIAKYRGSIGSRSSVIINGRATDILNIQAMAAGGVQIQEKIQ